MIPKTGMKLIDKKGIEYEIIKVSIPSHKDGYTITLNNGENYIVPKVSINYFFEEYKIKGKE